MCVNRLKRSTHDEVATRRHTRHLKKPLMKQNNLKSQHWKVALRGAFNLALERIQLNALSKFQPEVTLSSNTYKASNRLNRFDPSFRVCLNTTLKNYSLKILLSSTVMMTSYRELRIRGNLKIVEGKLSNQIAESWFFLLWLKYGFLVSVWKVSLIHPRLCLAQAHAWLGRFYWRCDDMVLILSIPWRHTRYDLVSFPVTSCKPWAHRGCVELVWWKQLDEL